MRDALHSKRTLAFDHEVGAADAFCWWNAMRGKRTKSVQPKLLYAPEKVITCTPQHHQTVTPQILVFGGFPGSSNTPYDQGNQNNRRGCDEGTCRCS